MFITKKHISRRTMLQGVGATMALPFLESMLPAMGAQTKKPPVRVACMEMVQGAAGSVKIGVDKNWWSPAAEGREFDLSPGSLLPLDAWKDHLTIVSNTDMRPAEAYELHEVGGDHFRTLRLGIDRAADALVPPDRRVRVQPHDERVPEGTRAPQVPDVAGVQKVEDAVGEHDRTAPGSNPTNELDDLIAGDCRGGPRVWPHPQPRASSSVTPSENRHACRGL